MRKNGVKNFGKIVTLLLALSLMFSLLGCGGGNASSAAGTSDSSAQEQTSDKVYSLKLAGSMAVDAPVSQRMEKVAEICNEKSNGRLQIKTYPANQLGDSTLVFESLMDGSVDMGCFFNSNSYDPRIAINSLPYLATTTEEMKKIYSRDSNYYQAYSQIIGDLNIKLLGTHVDGWVGVLFTEYPTNYNDVTAKKDQLIRIPGVDAYKYMMSDMGYNTVSVAWADLYTALQTGVCDGAVGATLVSCYDSFRDVTKYWAPYHCTIENLDYMINADTWNSLPEDLQVILQDAIDEVTAQQIDELDGLEAEYQKKLVEENGIQILPFTDEELQAYAQVVRDNTWPKIADTVGQDLIDTIKQDLN